MRDTAIFSLVGMMQLFARRADGSLVPVSLAERHEDHSCLECGRTVRVRAGRHRRAHYYHVHPSEACRQNGKSMTHLQVQCYLQDLLPKGACELEVPFPAVKRIADAIWREKRLVFEVQCSSISEEEVLARNRDYATQGYQVVWVLHRRKFGKQLVSAAESALKAHPHYFTDIDCEGNGVVYDMFWIERTGRRIYRSDRFPVDLSQPQPTPQQLPSDQPFLLARWRQAHWPLYFSGDLIDHYICGNDVAEFYRIEATERALPDPAGPLLRRVGRSYRSLHHGCTVLLRLLLERACR